jgi:hypothetical protein
MERAIAVKKLGRLLGKSLGYRVDPKGATAEEREAAHTALKAAGEKARDLGRQREARINYLLENDAEFQQIKAAHEAAKKEQSRLMGILHHFKFTVGTRNGMFFHVKAQGDSWEEVIAKIESDKR